MRNIVTAALVVALALSLVLSAGWAGKVKETAAGTHAVITTDLGTIDLLLMTGEAPKTTKNFIRKAKAKAFDGTTFHRVVPGFVIQGGDPNSRDDDPGNDGCGGGNMPIEARMLSNAKGTVSMASSSSPPIEHQSDFQFFVNLKHNRSLDEMGFIPFAKVTGGMDVVEKIAKQPRDGNDRPLKSVVIRSITIK